MFTQLFLILHPMQTFLGSQRIRRETLIDKFGWKWRKFTILYFICCHADLLRSHYFCSTRKFTHNRTARSLIVKCSTCTNWSTQKRRFPGSSINDSIIERVLHEVSLFLPSRDTVIKDISGEFFARRKSRILANTCRVVNPWGKS